MNLPVVEILFIAAALCVGIVLTVRAFKRKEGHDPATTELLTRFFDGKQCAICKQPIPPVRRMGLKPGLLNPTTRDTHAWNEIPTENLSSALETLLPLCSACGGAESFRQRFRNLVLDRD